MNDDAKTSPLSPTRSERFAAFAYRRRFSLALLVVATTVFFTLGGVQRILHFSEDVASLADTSNGTGDTKLLAFNPTMDVWFGEEDAAVQTFYGIEDQFVAEDYVVVAFEDLESEFGVFSRQSLSTIQRLTESFLRVPGVRHVRSLTYSPWIRWGQAEEDGPDGEESLIISDLVEEDPQTLDDDAILTRMIASLGAERTAARVGEDRVRAVLGPDARFEDFIGEPLLLGTIINEDATTTTIQVQVLRPHIDEALIDEVFDDEDVRKVAPHLSSIEQQRAALRGLEHFLRIERGEAIPTPQRSELERWIDSLPEGDKKESLRTELSDPTKNFMKNEQGLLVRKFYEYERTSSGWVDRSDPGNAVEAPADFAPKPRVPYEFHIGGGPVFERNFEVTGISDGKFLPFMFLVIAIVLFLVFRNISGVFIPLAVVFGSISGMLGLSLAFGHLLNNMTILTPNLLTAVAIADAIHLISAWIILRPRYQDKASLIQEVVRRNALPVMLTSVTTAIGFSSLVTSAIEPVKMLGLMTAIGTCFAWAISMTVVPALLSLVPHKPTAGKTTAVENIFSEKRSEAFVDRVLAHRKGVLIVSVMILVVSLYGITQIEIDSDFRSMFPDDNPTMSDFNWIEPRIGGLGDLDLVFSGAKQEPQGIAQEPLSLDEENRLAELHLRAFGYRQFPDEFAALTENEQTELHDLEKKNDQWNRARIGVSPDFLDALERFENRLRDEATKEGSPLAVVTDYISPMDILRKIHQVQNENRAAFYRVPGHEDVSAEAAEASLEFDEWTEEWSLLPAQTGSTLIAQYYLQYESGARPGEALGTQLSADRLRFRVQGRVEQASSIAHLEAFERIREIVREDFPEFTMVGEDSDSEERLAELTLSGKVLLFARTTDLISHGYMKSMGLALVIITILIGIIFRSLSLAAISLIPNVLPIILPLSFFGLLGIPLDGPSIFVSSVALGVCVDDTIHFFTKYVRSREKGQTPRRALIMAMTEAGTAMTVTTVVLIIGFCTLLFSDFSPNFQMGALAAIMIGLAWVADFLVTVAVLSLEPVKQPQQASTPMEVSVS